MRTIQPSEAGQYLNKLGEFIRESIELPEKALTHYAHQFNEQQVAELSELWLFLVCVSETGEIEGLILGSPQEGGVATIVWLLVSKNSQGLGLGKKLFANACDHYRRKGAHKLKLTTSEETTTNYYKTLGMRLEGIHKNHWWEHDFWAMGLDLNK
ncbi:MAG: GNAT family N-acetyltransferase [Pseudomonadales bacterium]|nr:GNAT family N-acetyltransferase [Pseudomonadales bacterium]MBO6596166.1 GNAT family N-acetyltransferase [Pseudomonadales bacterium]MBO6822646.1 GNAT family N-acetyltransferase [Pseudomonadales bacterium]